MKKPPFNAQLSRVNMKAANKFGFSKAILDIGKYPNMSPLQYQQLAKKILDEDHDVLKMWHQEATGILESGNEFNKKMSAAVQPLLFPEKK